MKLIVTKNVYRFPFFKINNNLLLKASFKTFGSNAHSHSEHHGSHDKSHSHNESHSNHGHHGNDDHHGHHGHHKHHGHDDHHGHHEITGEVDFQKIHVKNDKDLHKYVSLIGLNNGESNLVENHEHGHYKAILAQRSLSIPLLHQGRRQYRQLTGTLYEDNPYFHPEPYGYLFTDDPFDSNGHTFHALALLMFGFLGILYCNYLFRKKNHPDAIAQSILHAHYAANLIEDEIIKIRDEDYPYRLKYAKLKAEAEGKTFEESNSEDQE